MIRNRSSGKRMWPVKASNLIVKSEVRRKSRRKEIVIHECRKENSVAPVRCVNKKSNGNAGLS